MTHNYSYQVMQDQGFCMPMLHNGVHKFMPGCTNGRFRDGAYSHIRGDGVDLAPKSKVFPGTMQIGNESGANGPIYITNPDYGHIEILKRRYNGTPGFTVRHFKNGSQIMPSNPGYF